MEISLVRPFFSALNDTKRLLFRPFKIGQWFRLGFLAFLSLIGKPIAIELGEFESWITASQLLFLANLSRVFGFSWVPPSIPALPSFSLPKEMSPSLFIVGLLVGILAIILLTFLGILWSCVQTRGMFMFIGGLARPRESIHALWNEQRDNGKSMFFFLIQLWLILLVMSFIVWLSTSIILGSTVGIDNFLASPLSSPAFLPIVLAGILLFVFAMILLIFIVDFVVPIIYCRGLGPGGVWGAWHYFINSFWNQDKKSIVNYSLLRVLMLIGIVAIAKILTIVTFNLASIPYLGSLLLLPLSVFQQVYPLRFIEQFGADWQILSNDRS